MMICKADFEELFPATFKPKLRSSTVLALPEPAPACIARWEDDGGRTTPVTVRPGLRSVHPSHYGSRMAAPARTGIAVSMFPAMAAYGATAAMLSTFAKLAEAGTAQRRARLPDTRPAA